MSAPSRALLRVLLVALVGLAVGSPAASAKSPFQLVVLGDSYSAGNGAGSYVGPAYCLRSARNWGAMYRDAVVATQRYSYVKYMNRACSGGVTQNIVSPRIIDSLHPAVTVEGAGRPLNSRVARTELRRQGKCRSNFPNGDEYYTISPKEPLLPPNAHTTTIRYECTRKLHAQVNNVTDDTSMVMLSMGGNDVNFGEIVKKCLLHLGPGALSDCRSLINKANKILEGTAGEPAPLTSRIADALRAVKSRLRPEAFIVVNSYPFLERYPDAALKSLAEGEYDVGFYLRDMQARADAKVRGVIRALNKERGAKIYFTDSIKSDFANHEPSILGARCAANTKAVIKCKNDYEKSLWIHRLRPLNFMETYHPNLRGHQAISDANRKRGYTSKQAENVGRRSLQRDIVFVVDTNGVMGPALSTVKSSGAAMIDSLKAEYPGARFGVVDFRASSEVTGHAGDYPSRVVTDLTGDSDVAKAALGSLDAGPSDPDVPAAGAGIDDALDLDWRPPVDKSIIVLGRTPDAGAQHPYTLGAVDVESDVRLSDAFDRNYEDLGASVSWFKFGSGTIDDGGGPIITSSVRAPHRPHVRRRGRARHAAWSGSPVLDAIRKSGGEAFDVEQTSLEAATQGWIATTRDMPVARAGEPQAAAVGAQVAFDGSNSYSPNSRLVGYAWDFDNDGAIDETTSEPTTTHAFSLAGVHTVGLRVTDDAGRTAQGSVSVLVSLDGDHVDADTDNCLSVANDDQADADHDGIGDACDDTPGFLTSSTDAFSDPSAPHEALGDDHGDDDQTEDGDREGIRSDR